MAPEVIEGDRYQRLLEICSLLNSKHRAPGELLEYILDSALTQMSGVFVSILLYNAETQSLYPELSLGVKPVNLKKESFEKGSPLFSAFEREQDYVNVQPSGTIIALPLYSAGAQEGLFLCINHNTGQEMIEQDILWLRRFRDVSGLCLSQYRSLQKKDEVNSSGTRLIFKSSIMQGLADICDRIAKAPSSVLITGESGTGKEIMAQRIHELSDRSTGPLISVNCAAIPSDLIESELFGYVKGAFTGAERDYKGRFEKADGGTLFLDEIGELSLDAQAKILRVIQDQQVERLGSTSRISVNIRYIAATNRNLEEEVRAGRFRKDLYYRLHVLPLRIPPLRERPEDIPALAEYFLEKYSYKSATGKRTLSSGAMESLISYRWPGNVRELENTIERAIIIGAENVIESTDLSLPLRIDKSRDKYKDKTLKDAVNAFKRNYLEQVLQYHRGNQTEAARELGIQRTYLSRLLKELDINR